MPGSGDARVTAAIVAILLLSLPAARAGAEPLFTDITGPAGIPPLRFAEGVNAVDLTGDGLADLLLPNARGAGKLLVNVGGLRFEDATERLGAPGARGVGAVAADLTGDGRADLLLVSGNNEGGANRLFIAGPEAGAYAEAAATAGLSGGGNGISAAAADVDLDGRIDVAVSTWSGVRLYRNVSTAGAPRFEEVTAAAGLAGEGRGWGATFADLTGDHLPDLFIARGTKGREDPSRLFVNEGGGRFRDATTSSGISGIRWGTGGVPADFDGDGDLDLLVTNLEGRDRLFRNDGAGVFADVTADSGVTSGRSHGASAGDVDGDRLPDLVVAGFGEPLRALRNLGGMRFADATADWGLEPTGRNMGTVLADLDGDGDLDCYVANVDGKNRLYRNDGGLPAGGAGRLIVDLARLPLGGIGAETVLLAAGGGAPLARIDLLGGFGYCSQGPARVGFLLPPTPCDLAITLPGGAVIRHRGVRPGMLDATLSVEAGRP